jgi:fibronectin-binding autotransporter adhesin
VKAAPSRRYPFLAPLTATLLFPAAAFAQFTWDGGGTNNNVSSAANWAGDTLPANDGTAAVTFSGATRSTPYLDTNLSVASLGFGTAAQFFLQGSGTLTISSSIDTSTRSPHIEVPVILNGDVAITGTNIHFSQGLSGSGSLTINTATGFGLSLTGGTVNYAAPITIISGYLSMGLGRLVSGNVTNNGSLFFNDGGSGAGTFAGSISGTGSVGFNSGSSTSQLTLSGTNTYSGSTNLGVGQTITGAANVLSPNSPIVLSGFDPKLFINHSQTIAGFSGSAAAGREIAVATGTVLTSRARVSLTYSALLSGGGALVIDGRDSASGTSYTQSLNGANTYTGGTTVQSGILRVANTTGSATGTGAVTVKNTGMLRGSGTIAGDVTLESGGAITGGSTGPFTLNLGNLTLESGSILQLGMNDAAGTAGALTGWSFLSLGGVLDLGGTGADPLSLRLVSLGAGGISAAAANFDAAADASFLVATAAGGITGFDVSAWSVDASQFVNSYSGIFSLSQSGNSLFVDYTAAAAVPEPSTYALLAGVAALGLVWWRRRAVGSEAQLFGGCSR